MPEKYNYEYGRITHVHIYPSYDDPVVIKAGLTFASGEFRAITWSDNFERQYYLPGIDGYTLFIDDRVSPAHAATYRKQ